MRREWRSKSLSAGDLWTFINSLANVYETGILEFILFRPGSKGLHLIEAVALLIKNLPESFRYAICLRYGARLNQEQKAESAQAVRQQIAEYDTKVRESIGDRLVWCNGEEEEIRSILAGGETLGRAVMVLNNSVLEAGTRGILTQVYGNGRPGRTLQRRARKLVKEGFTPAGQDVTWKVIHFQGFTVD